MEFQTAVSLFVSFVLSVLLVRWIIKAEIKLENYRRGLFESAQGLGIRCRAVLYTQSLTYGPYPIDCPDCHKALVIPLTKEMRQGFSTGYGIFGESMSVEGERALFVKLGTEKARCFCAGCGKEYNIKNSPYGMLPDGEVHGGLNLLEILSKMKS